ncbi:MAG: GNAT family N-acetyltransferase [Geminicoccaceae bacterium]
MRYTGPGHGGHKIYPDSFAYIRAVAVSPDHLRHGIGRQLTEKCIEVARRHAAEAVGLHVARENDAARTLYARLGFKFYREVPDYFGIPYEAFYIRF